MFSRIEHTVGIYIGLLLLVCLAGIVAMRLTGLPHAITLTVAPLLHLPRDLPEAHGAIATRATIVAAGFVCVFFSLVIQGSTLRPLVSYLGISGTDVSEPTTPGEA